MLHVFEPPQEVRQAAAPPGGGLKSGVTGSSFDHGESVYEKWIVFDNRGLCPHQKEGSPRRRIKSEKFSVPEFVGKSQIRFNIVLDP